MLIKHQTLSFTYNRSFPAVFIIIGRDFFLNSQVTNSLKSSWQKHQKYDCEQKIIDIESQSDWHLLEDEANSYSLFSTSCLLDIRFDKKSLDVTGKNFLNSYLERPNSRTLLLITAPNLSPKALLSLTNHAQLVIIHTLQPDKRVIIQWIGEQFKQASINFDSSIPGMLEQYTSGNLLASSQFIEKIILTHDAKTPLTLDIARDHLFNQCEYQVFELGDICLRGDEQQALLTLKALICDRTECTLVLWIITQEIRNLLKISELLTQNIALPAALSQLKIWANRASLYQSAVKRHTIDGLRQLLKTCHNLDVALKSTQSEQTYRNLELLVLALTSGKSVVYFE